MAAGVVAGGDVLGVFRQLPHGLADAAGDPERSEGRGRERGERDEQDDVFQLAGGGEFGGQGTLQGNPDRGFAEQLQVFERG